MYQVKHSEKGRVEEFDIGVYNREAYAERTRREFRQLLSNAQVFYCFQPIFSARSGRVVAYEALMRSDLPTLRSPATIMKLAREQGHCTRSSASPLPRRWRPSTACAGRAVCPGMPCSLSTPSPEPA